MEIHIRTALRARTQWKSNSRVEKETFHEPRPYEVATAERSDAPVVASWDDVEIRLHRDRHFRRAFRCKSVAYSSDHDETDFDLTGDRVFLSSDEALDALATGRLHQNFNGTIFAHKGIRKVSFTQRDEWSTGKGAPVKKYRLFEPDEVENAVEADRIRRWAQDILIIDGDFWVACPRPTYMLDGTALIPQAGRFMVEGETFPFAVPYRRLGINRVFGAGELDLALELVATLGGVAPSATISLDPVADGASIYSPEEGIVEAVEYLFRRLGRGSDPFANDGLRGKSPSTLRAVADLQEVTFRRELTSIDPDDLAEALDACLGRLGKAGEPELTPSDTAILGMAVRRLTGRLIEV